VCNRAPHWGCSAQGKVHPCPFVSSISANERWEVLNRIDNNWHFPFLSLINNLTSSLLHQPIPPQSWTNYNGIKPIHQPGYTLNNLIWRTCFSIAVVGLPHIRVHHQVRRICFDHLGCLRLTDYMGHVCAEEGTCICAEEGCASIVFWASNNSYPSLLPCKFWDVSNGFLLRNLRPMNGINEPLWKLSSNGGTNFLTWRRSSWEDISVRDEMFMKYKISW